jgi:hypothetical protein
MLRRPFVNVLALVAAFVVGSLLTNRPTPATAQPAGGHGKCVGITAATHSGTFLRVFRAFEDGTVDVAFDGPAGSTPKWEPFVK